MRYRFESPSAAIATAIRSCPRSEARSERKNARPTKKRGQPDREADGDLARGRARFASSTAQRQPVITAVIGLKERIHCHFSGISLTAYITPESSGRTWRNTGIM